MRIGNLVRKLTPRKFKEIMAYSNFDEFSRKVYSQEGEDLLLSRIFEHSPPGFYVDVGAHHPFRFSNTKLLYDMGWRGINVEPNPESIKLFVKHRVGDQIVNCGVGCQNMKMDYFMFSHPALNSFDRKVYDEKKDQHIKTLTVEVQPLSAILNKYLPYGQNVDLLLIDVEGFDFDVLKSNDWDKFNPSFILVEASFKKLEDAMEGPIHTFLHGKGYALVSKLWKTCLYRKNHND